MVPQSALDWCAARLGQEIHCGEWLLIDQQRIDAFAAVTDDRQWLHVDVLRAGRESPWGATIAHGYLTLSLYPALRGHWADAAGFGAVQRVINVGLNRLRFVNAVKVDSRIRVRVTLSAFEELRGALQIVEDCTFDIDGEAKPACVAELLMRLYF